MTDPGRRPRLPTPALTLRLFHAGWAVLQLTGLTYLWSSAARRRRGAVLPFAVGFLALQGGALILGRGDCPLGAVQRALGDEVPLFELILPPVAARAAVPVLTGVTIAALCAVALRPPVTGQPPAQNDSTKPPSSEVIP
jgi:hypothetical protein